MKTLRDIIVDEVRRQGLSGYRLARLADVPERALQRFLGYQHDLPSDRLTKIVHALGLELRKKSVRHGKRNH